MRLTISPQRIFDFEKVADKQAFERPLGESLLRADAPRLLAYCLMPNHWHIVVRASAGTDRRKVRIARGLSLNATARPRGRPPKQPRKAS